MILDNKLFDEILLRAQESPRRRMNFDLRTQAQIPGQAGNDVEGQAGNDVKGQVRNDVKGVAGNDGEEWLYKWLQTAFL